MAPVHPRSESSDSESTVAKQKGIEWRTWIGDDHAIARVRDGLEHRIQGRTSARCRDNSVQRARVYIEFFAEMATEDMPQIQTSAGIGTSGMAERQGGWAWANSVKYRHSLSQINDVGTKRCSQSVEGEEVRPGSAEGLARVVSQERPGAIGQVIDAR
jgi:hypothetical protein